jgi:hypothetical protein
MSRINTLTKDAETDLREFLRSPSGHQVMNRMREFEPYPLADKEHPLETMALSGAITTGWKRCLRKLIELSDTSDNVTKQLQDIHS